MQTQYAGEVATNGVALNAQQRKSVETTRIKAQTLWADGYQLQNTTKAMVYTVIAPDVVTQRTGEIVPGPRYTVDAYAGTCDCMQFAGCGECKHQIAVQEKVRAALALLTPIEDVPAPVVVPASVAVPASVGAYGSAAYQRSVARDFE